MLELGRLEGGKGGGELMFRPLCTTWSGAHGAFVLHRLLPQFAALRLRASDRTTVVQPVQVGDTTVRLDLPKPRAPFRRR